MPIIAPVGLVKFFGNLAIMDSPQQVCESYPAFQNKVFEMALDPDPAMIGVALDTLGLLGSTVEGKQVLQKTGKSLLCLKSRGAKRARTPLRMLRFTFFMIFVASSGEKFKAVWVRMSQLASSGATELRVRSLDAISQLLTLQVHMFKQEQLSSPCIFFKSSMMIMVSL